MINVLKTYKHQIFYWFVAIVAMVIPFPSYSLVSQSIIGLGVFWLFFFNSFSEKIGNLKQNYKLFFLIFIPYFLTVIGLFYTNNMSMAMKDLVLKLPFLILPLIFFSVQLKPNTGLFAIKYFSYAVVVAMILALSKAFYLKFNDLGSFFYYDKYSELIGKHSTNSALFIVIAVLFFIYSYIKSGYKSYKYIILVFFLLFNLYLISNRISIIALVIGTLILLFYMMSSKLKWIVSLFIILSVFIVYQTDNFQKRFKSDYIEGRNESDIVLRMYHWKSVLETIKHENIFFGTGTAANKPYLYEKYRSYEIESAYKKKYNAHNQFLEFALENGIFGFLLFVLSLLYIFKKLVKEKSIFAVAVLSVVMIFMLTDSLFERQSGILVYSLFISLFLQNNHPNEK